MPAAAPPPDSLQWEEERGRRSAQGVQRLHAPDQCLPALPAEVGVDDALVMDTKEEIFEMNNGCICCTGEPRAQRRARRQLRHMVLAHCRSAPARCCAWVWAAAVLPCCAALLPVAVEHSINVVPLGCRASAPPPHVPPCLATVRGDLIRILNKLLKRKNK